MFRSFHCVCLLAYLINLTHNPKVRKYLPAGNQNSPTPYGISRTAPPGSPVYDPLPLALALCLSHRTYTTVSCSLASLHKRPSQPLAATTHAPPACPNFSSSSLIFRVEKFLGDVGAFDVVELPISKCLFCHFPAPLVVEIRCGGHLQAPRPAHFLWRGSMSDRVPLAWDQVSLRDPGPV